MKTKIYSIALCLSIIVLSNLTSFCQAPDWQWAKSAGGVDNAFSGGIAVDAYGNSYITGHFEGPSITFGSITLTNAKASTYDTFIVKYDESGNVKWAKRIGGTYNDLGFNITIDAKGNPCITGNFFSHHLFLGGTTLTNTNPGSPDIFIIKYDTSGNVLWAKSAGGTDYDFGSSIAAGANGNLYVTGSFISDSIHFDSITLVNANAPMADVFIARYDSSGNVAWAKRAGGNGGEGSACIAVDTNDNLYIIGSFNNDSLIFGNDTLISMNNFGDIFVAKYDAFGNALWAKKAGNNNKNNSGNSIAADANGNSYVTGFFQSDTITFDSDTLININTNADIFLVKYDNSGNVVWAKSAGGTAYDIARSTKTDANGDVYITGDFTSDTINFGSITLINTTGVNQYIDIYVAKYDSSGNELWAKRAGGTNFDYGRCIALDSIQNVYITGIFNSDSLTFGSTQLTKLSGVNYNIFITKLDNVTGFTELSPSNPISIFPNPTTSQISITYSKTIDEITITNPLGQIIYHAKPYDKHISLRVNDDGIYFVTVTSANKTATGKVIVQR
ncbi:MAG: SBBP repeat-containing protein [Bacteroidia bacterium]